MQSIQPYLDSIEFVEVSDFLADRAFDEAVCGVDYVLHPNSPIPQSPNPDFVIDVKTNMINSAIKGMVDLLQFAAKSKFGASMPGPYDLVLVPDAEKVPANERLAYCASKTPAYKAAQDFMASEQPPFDLVNILPSCVQGPNELVTRKEDVHNGSTDVMVDLVLGAKGGLPRQASTVFVDDVAKV